eukprot:scaffold33712_cov57-Attheya_sp.AAC.2
MSTTGAPPARADGTCCRCGKIQTHVIRKGLAFKKRTPVQVVTDGDAIVVYKGYHVTCFGGLNRVKVLLGEAPSGSVAPSGSESQSLPASASASASASRPTTAHVVAVPTASPGEAEIHADVISEEDRHQAPILEIIPDLLHDWDDDESSLGMDGMSHMPLELPNEGDLQEQMRRLERQLARQERQAESETLRLQIQTQQRALQDMMKNYQREKSNQNLATIADEDIHTHNGTEATESSEKTPGSEARSSSWASQGEVDPTLEENIRNTIETLHMFSQEGDYEGVLEVLVSRPKVPRLVRETFSALRNSVVVAHAQLEEQHPAHHFSSTHIRSKIDLPPSWVKDVASCMRKCTSRVEVQKEGLFTLWTIATIVPQCKKDILGFGGVDAIMKSMQKHGDLSEEILLYSCGTLSCIAESVPTLRSKYPPVVELLLMTILNVDSPGPKKWALRALYSIATNSDSMTGDALAVLKDMRRVAVSSNGVEIILDAIGVVFHSHGDAQDGLEVAVWGLQLLQYLSYLEWNAPGKVVGAELFLTEENISTSTTADNVTQRVAEAMTNYLQVATVQEAGCRVLANLVAVVSKKDDVRATGLTYPCFFSIIEVAVQTMLAYPDVASLQLASFETFISLFKSTDVEAELKKYMKAIMNAFRTHVVDRPLSLTPKDYDSVFEGVCTLLASLAVCEEASPALHSLSILKESFAVCANIGNSPIPPSLGLLTRNMLKNKVAVAKFFPIHIEAVAALVMEMMRMTRKELFEWVAESLFLFSSVSKPYIDAILLMGSESGGALDQIARAMMLFSDSDRIVKYGSAFMANVYANVQHSADVDKKVATAVMLMNGNAGNIHQKPIVSIRTVNEARAILQGIRLHSKSSDVLTHAFLAMRNFLCVATDSTSGISETEMQSVLISAVDSAVQALIAHPSSLAVLENACGALWGLSSRSPEICFAVGRAGAILSIYDAMDEFPHEQELQENALGALASLCSIAENIEEAGLEEGVASIVHCLETFSEEETIAEKGISVMSALSSGSYDAKVVLVQQDNSVNRIIESMYKYPSSARIVMDACSAISNLTIDPLVSQNIASQGGIDRLANATREHSSNPIVLENVISAIAALVTAVDNEILHGNDITFCVFQTRRLHIEDPGVQAKFLSVILSLVMKDAVGATTKIGVNMQELKRRDVCRLVLESTQYHIGHLGVQQFGMEVIWWLANDEECQKDIVRYDGISIILNALMAHTTDFQVQKSALGTICILGREPEHKVIIAEDNGVDTIVGTIWINMNSPEIVSMGCTALANIAFNGKTHEVARIMDIEVEAVTSAMDEYPESEIVQSSACVLLRNSTFAHENIYILSNCEKLPRLLRTAIANFPNECSERVTFIVSSLGLEWDH